ncbi:hypothetical protein CONLIGDRAFT_630346 [Coniochaeta ligniaria NRRL 30616]|uniref:Uncharacterized protein n=1 Tax=Coniochaeta ligniaria NRRL 30616 TaxID=1408157 RepID=A0A1J7JH80_9PEZI|nr:hypothetical protein CONLIGDRAFT_630346 [Coniochaeta ligniaria NRRL 30616]
MARLPLKRSPNRGNTPIHDPGRDADSSLLRPGHVDPNNSIVILGEHGVGKSTLAVMAYAALGRCIVEFDVFLQRSLGMSERAFEDKHSKAESAARKLLVLRELLATYSKGCIIVCPLSCAESDGGLLIRHFAMRHPVIHVVSNLQQSGVSDSDLNSIMLSQNNTYQTGRFCSNYLYYNLAESHANSPLRSPPCRGEHSTGSYPSRPSTLRLKRVEQDFLRFLRSVYAMPRRTGTQELPLSTSLYTYALTLTLPELSGMRNLEGLLNDGPDAVEIRIDPSGDDWCHVSSTSGNLDIVSREFTSVRRVFTGPVIYHVIKPVLAQSSPSKPVSAETKHISTYLELLSHGLRLGADYVTVDLSCDDSVFKKIVTCRGATNIIGHFHDASPGPEGWNGVERMEKFSKAERLGCQMVRLTQVATSAADNDSVQQFVYRIRKAWPLQPSLIAYNTGFVGRNSCCLNKIFTPVSSTPWTIEEKGPTLPDSLHPCLTLSQAQTALFSSFKLNQMRFYVIGNNVSGSLAPPMYQAAFKHMGMPHSFTPKSMLTPEGLEVLVKAHDFGGATIGQGLKLSVIPYVSRLSHDARLIGAVNTIIPIRHDWEGEAQERGTPPLSFWQERNIMGPVKGLYGDNTDWIGIRRSISKRLSPANAVSSRTTCLILGAGGMARAAVYAMLRLDVRHIFIYNRTTEKARSLADYFNNLFPYPAEPKHHRSGTASPVSSGHSSPSSVRVHVIESLDLPWPEHYAQPTIIISCIRAPIEGPQPVITIPPQWMKSPNSGVVLDVSYRPFHFRTDFADDTVRSDIV